MATPTYIHAAKPPLGWLHLYKPSIRKAWTRTTEAEVNADSRGPKAAIWHRKDLFGFRGSIKRKNILELLDTFPVMSWFLFMLWQDLIGGRIAREGLLPLGAPANDGLGSSSSGAAEEWLDLDPGPDPDSGCLSGGSATPGGTAVRSDGEKVSWNLLFGVVCADDAVWESSAFSGERIDSMR
nr:uncharacterized protein CTRU02_01537 [Colletotrichum truncatum]KAF6799857.1 hypothetical protein CTRU02_01537 [Colletotrichum truncatum]